MYLYKTINNGSSANYTYTYIHVHIYTYIYTHTYICTYIYILMAESVVRDSLQCFCKFFLPFWRHWWLQDILLCSCKTTTTNTHRFINRFLTNNGICQLKQPRSIVKTLTKNSPLWESNGWSKSFLQALIQTIIASLVNAFFPWVQGWELVKDYWTEHATNKPWRRDRRGVCVSNTH